MNTDKILSLQSICVHLCSSVVLLSGCTAPPNQANIALRKENQTMQAQIADLQRQHDADAAMIRSQQKNPTTTLSQDQLDKLFTTHDIEFGRLTGGAKINLDSPVDDGIKVYIYPTDGSSQPIKAAGSFVVEVFDLAKQSDNLVGHWEFPVSEAKKNWYGHAMLYTYVLPCSWQNWPMHHELTLRVTFRDELTQAEFVKEKVIHVNVR
jgi:hypothetical protein